MAGTTDNVENGKTLSKTRLSWESLAKASGFVFGIMYATGFLVVFTFLAGYGITDFVGDLLRLKYFYVGILCTSFPAFVAIPLVLKVREVWPEAFFDRPAHNPHSLRLIRNRWSEIYRTPALLIVLNMIAMIYIVIGLFTATEYRTRQIRIEILLLGSIVLLWLCKKATSMTHVKTHDKTQSKGHHSNSDAPHRRQGDTDSHADFLLFILRFAVFCAAVGFDFYVCYGLGISDVFIAGLYYSGLMLAFAWRAVRLDTQLRYEAPIGGASIAAQGAIVCALYIVACLSYAATVYPLVPMSYGGGDYESSPNEVLCFTGSTVPAEIMAGSSCTVPVKIMHETESMIYIAPSFADGSESYMPSRKAPGIKDRALDWQRWKNLPKIYGVSTKFIASQSDADEAINELSIDQAPISLHTYP